MRKKGRSPISIWEGAPNLLGEENPKVMGFAATTDPSRLAETSTTELAHSFLHWKAARPQILTYTDNIDDRDEKFKTQVKSLRNHYLHKVRVLYLPKGTKGEKCVKEARIKKQRQFPMRD